MMKIYIKESTEKSIDNEVLQIVEVHLSKPSDLTYLVFTEK